MAKNRLTIGQEGAFDRSIRTRINNNFSDVSVCDTQLDVTSSTTLVNISGMVTENLVPGATYKFYARIPMVCTANNGSKFAFKMGAASMISAIEYEAKQLTASAVAVSRGTTATDQALIADNVSAVVVMTEIMGIVVLNDTGALRAAQAIETLTLQLQAAQHTSHADTFSVYKYAHMQFERIATS